MLKTRIFAHKLFIKILMMFKKHKLHNTNYWLKKFPTPKHNIGEK